MRGSSSTMTICHGLSTVRSQALRPACRNLATQFSRVCVGGERWIGWAQLGPIRPG